MIAMIIVQRMTRDQLSITIMVIRIQTALLWSTTGILSFEILLIAIKLALYVKRYVI